MSVECIIVDIAIRSEITYYYGHKKMYDNMLDIEFNEEYFGIGIGTYVYFYAYTI